MRVLSQEEIKQPTGSLVVEQPRETDWEKDHPVLGGDVLGGLVRTVLCPALDWTDSITEYELQRNGIFDPFDCVTQTEWNKVQCLVKKQYGIVLNKSKRWTAVKSGTKPGVGNSVNNVAESIRLQGGVPESVWPTMTAEMTETQFYATPPASVDSQEDFLVEYGYNHEYVPRINTVVSSLEELKDSLKYSPIAVSVGNYSFDQNGLLYSPSSPNYCHEVLIVKIDSTGIYTLDSENASGLLKYRFDYPFGWPKIGYVVKKKISKPIIYKQTGQPALYVKHWSQNLLIPFMGGVIPGGDMFKTLYGISDYSQMNILESNSLPYPVSGYGITTK